MNTQELIARFAKIANEKEWSNTFAANKFLEEYPKSGISHRTLRRKISKARQMKEEYSGKIEVIENEKNKTFEYKGERSLTSKEEAVEFFQIDLTKEEVYQSVFNSWDVTFKNADGEAIKRTNYQVKLFVRPKQKSTEDFHKNILEQIKKLSNLPKSINRKEYKKEPYLLVIDPADIHIGKLCDPFEVKNDYNNQIAIERALKGVEGILSKARGFEIDQILFVGGNDILHVDNTKRTTTSGTPQDTDGMWYSNFLLAKELYISILNNLLTVADVHFVYNPSNHDYTTGFFLADVIKTYYKDCSNITFDTSPAYRKYFKYGENLIGTTHGDGAKPADLPLLMAHESENWSNTKHRYIYSHHVHHKISKDYIGVTFETLRSPSGSDSWHTKNGYVGVPKAVEGFIHCPKFGQVARLTHAF
jgi:hypothetical protein